MRRRRAVALAALLLSASAASAQTQECGPFTSCGGGGSGGGASAFEDLTGSLACAQTPAFTGDVTTSAGSCTTTATWWRTPRTNDISSGNCDPETELGRARFWIHGAGAIVTPTYCDTGGAYAAWPVSTHAASHGDNGTDEVALDASQITTGQLAAAQAPGFTGDVVSTAGSGVTTIDANKVTAGMVAFNYAASTSEAGPATTATALAANGANCSAASFPLGVDASGAVESCSTSISGNAATATALAANGANCSAGNYPLGVDASGAVESCTAAPAGLSGLGSSDNSIVRTEGTGGIAAQGSILSIADTDALATPALALGTDLNTGVSWVAGADKVSLVAGGIEVVRANTAASGINYINITPAASGGGDNGPIIKADGSSTNVDLLVDTKGSTSRIDLRINGVTALDINAATGTTRFMSGGAAIAAGGSIITNSGSPIGWSDAAISRGAAGIVWKSTSGVTPNRLAFDQGGNTCVVATDQTNATTTPQTWACYVTGSTAIALVASRRYRFHCQAFLSDSTAVDGAAVDFDASTATATTFRQQTTAFDTALNVSTQTTALATDVTASTFTGAGAFESHGYIKVNAAGTFQPRFMQVAHTAGTLTLAEGSNCVLDDVTP